MTPGVFLRTRCISVPSQSLVFLALAFSTILLAWTSCASAQIRFVPKTLVVRANGNPWNQIDVEFAVDTRIPNPDGTSGVFRPIFWRIKASMGSTTIWDQSSGGPEVDDHKIAKSFTVKNEGDYSVDISAWLADSGECARGTICNS